MIVLRLLLKRGHGLWTTTGLSRQSRQAGYYEPRRPLFHLTLANRKQKSLIAISISRLGGKLLFAVEHARLDQNDGVVGENAAEAIIIPMPGTRRIGARILRGRSAAT